MPAHSVLLLDRDPASSELIQRVLSAGGASVTVMDDATAAINAAPARAHELSSACRRWLYF